MKNLKTKPRYWNPSFGPLFIMTVMALLVSCAGTPPILNDDGIPKERSITALEKVSLNGTDHWLLLRGRDKNAPLLLWLAGGPCGSEIGWTREYLADLENDFVFVNWDQPGAGKSFRSADFDEVTVEDYVAWTLEVSRYLLRRFDREKLVLAGHSWGTVIGMKAVAKEPELYHSYISVSQHVNAVENDRLGYDMVLQGAEEAGKRSEVKKLKEMGPPPYSTEERGHYTYLLSRLPRYTPKPASIGYQSFRSMAFPKEYTLIDSLNFIRGLLKAMNHIYPQLTGHDLEREIPAVEVPVHFVTGRYDQTCVQEIAHRYYQRLEAPDKHFYWFENSGHNPCYQEPEKFIRIIRNNILPPVLEAEQKEYML